MIIRIFWSLFFLGLAAAVAFVTWFTLQYGDATQKVIDYHPPLTTYIYDRNGEKIANIFGTENRAYATFDEIPPRLVEALLAIEDTAFFEHYGVNPDAIFRAIIKDIKAGKLVEGASTITQQLVKNTLLTREKKLSRKLKELVFSVKLEFELGKDEILERYFNAIYLGHGYYGVKTAAAGYFHKTLDQLTLKESAMLVGLPKAPSYYAPTRNYEPCLGRANRVIERMYRLGWIDESQYLEAIQERPVVYDDTLTQNRAPYVVDEVIRRASAMFPDITTGGYTIETTIDLPLQEAAREALRFAYDQAVQRETEAKDSNLSRLESRNGALVSLVPQSGAVLALVGGVDYTKSAYNRVTQARRQPGSAFKPFIYQVALDLGYSGATPLVDIARTYEFELDENETKRWQPKNYERDYKGMMPLREALVHSRNLATINLLTDIGLGRMLRELRRYGFEHLPPDLSLALGSISLSPLDLAGFYTVFANGGVIREPYLISGIHSHRRSWQAEPKAHRVTTPQQAFLMTTILEDVVQRGTGRNAQVAGIDIAGKTGTTNQSVDAWFAGYSPSVETVVWFGNDDNTPMLKRETGGRAAGPAFAYYYRKLLELYPQVPRRFEMPEEVNQVLFEGKKEYITPLSPLPVRQHGTEPDDELLF